MPSAKVAAKKKADDKAKAKLGVEDGEDKEGVEEGGEEEGEDDRQEGEDKEAFWCQAKKRAKEKGDQGREEKVKDGKESLRSLLHCLVQLSPSCPSEYK